MDIDALRQQIANMRQSLIDEEILDSQFIQLEQLQDYTENPNFVEEKITLYFDDSPAVIAKIEEGLDQGPPLDRAKLTATFNGSKAAVRGALLLLLFILSRYSNYLLCRCRAAVDKVKDEYNNLKSRLQAYFELLSRQPEAVESSNNQTAVEEPSGDDDALPLWAHSPFL
ncbi:Histidine-containing phosphotransfer protein 3 [Morella rubra]|uniref:Histidine-containing phosphotransfer protein n=1 Tax=Morella rubra TaxID=262757 RepID=A0A6A1VW37_9ROSI|nr:Histidine-containing phosphotransfer protein 3 [Morella rubra]